jgi:hypothetical protein
VGFKTAASRFRGGKLIHVSSFGVQTTSTSLVVKKIESWDLREVQVAITVKANRKRGAIEDHWWDLKLQLSCNQEKPIQVLTISIIMAFTDDAVKAKLSALNDTQESIVTAQSLWKQIGNEERLKITGGI